jgi:lipopolysaccharide exporter
LNKTIIKKNKKPFLKNIITLMTGTTIAQAIPIAASPILTRIYSPDDFGLLALFLSITSVLAVIITARYELAIILPKEDREAINLVALSILITSAISTLMLILVIISGKSLANILGNDSIYPWLYFVPLSLFLTGVYQALSYWSNRKKQYKILASNRVNKSIVTVGMNIGIGTFKDGATGLVIGNIIAQIVATVHLIVKNLRENRFVLYEVSFQQIKKTAKRYDQFPKVSMWSALLNTASLQLPIFILGAYFSSSVVGFFSLSQRVLSMPMTVLGSAVGQVFFQTSANLKNDDPKKLKSITYKSYRNMLLIGVIPTSFVFGFGDILFTFVFGQEWRIAGDFSRIISIWVLLVFISSPLALLYTVMEKEGSLFIFNSALFISRLFSLLIGALVLKDVLASVILFTLVSAIFYLWNNIYILKLVGISISKSLISTISLVTISFGIMLGLRLLLLSSIW